MNFCFHISLTCCVLFLVSFSTAAQPVQPPAAIPPAGTSWDDLVSTWEKLVLAGKVSESLPWAETALEKARVDSGETSLAYGSTLDFLGYSQHHSGRYTEAEQNFTKAVQHGEKWLGQNHPDYITRLSNLAMLHIDMDKYSQALTELEECVHLAEINITEDDPMFCILVNNLGVACESMGYYDAAMQHYLRALDLTGKVYGTDHTKYAYRLGNLSAVYRETGQPLKALEYAQKTLPIYEKKSGKENLQYCMSMYQIALAHYRCNQLAESVQTMEEILDICSRNNFPESTGIYDFKIFTCSIYKFNKQYDKAIAIGIETFDRYSKLFPYLYFRHARMTNNIMQVYEEQGNVTAAGTFAIESIRFYIEEMKGRFSEADQMQVYNTIRRLDQMHLIRFSASHPELTELTDAVFDYIMGLKGLALTTRKHIVHSLKASDDPQLIQQFEAWLLLQQSLSRQYALRPALRQANLDSLETAASQLERYLSKSSEPFRHSRLSATWHDVQAQLAPGEAAIEFSAVKLLRNKPNTYFAWVILPGQQHPVQVKLFDEPEAGDLNTIRRLYRFEPGADGKTLRELVWLPLEPLLRDVKTIYFAPDGIFHRINLGAIPIAAGQILSDKCRLHRIINTSQILTLKNEPVMEKPDLAMVFGGIRYESDSISLSRSNSLQSDMMPARTLMRERGFGSGDEWQFLPGSLAEAENTSQKLEKNGTKVLSAYGFQASEGFLKKKIRESAPDLLHLATHGFFFSRADTAASSGFQASANPMARTGLVLAGANRVWKGNKPLDGQEDGILTGLEISHLNLSETEIVVLSACRTGQGTEANGEGIIGLQRAFKMAGVRYILMTLWDVDDQQTREFMDLFYTSWLTSGQTVPDAFREAQQKMRSAYSKPFQPAAWAPFILLE